MSKTNNYYLELIYDYYMIKKKEKHEFSNFCSMCGKPIPKKFRTKQNLCYFHLLERNPEVEKE